MSTTSEPASQGALERALEAGDARLDDVVRAIATERLVDLSGLPPSAVAYALSRLPVSQRVVVLTADNDAAARMAIDLGVFGAEGEAHLVYPAHEHSPFVDLAPDRRAAMQRLSTLFHLAADLPWRSFVAPLRALARRVPPASAIVARSTVVRAEEEIDRDALIAVLSAGGYLRVPVVEDPGTFAVRGALVDIFPPHGGQPVRIELDDWLVLSIRRFDPEDQRTLEAVDHVRVHPVRDALYGPDELAVARVRIRDLCDAIDMPTRASKALIDDLDAGRLYAGMEALVPAFYPRLASLLDLLPSDAVFVLVDPTASVSAALDALDTAERDREARQMDRRPSFPLDAHYVEEGELTEHLLSGRLTRAHRVAVAGESEHGRALRALEAGVDLERVLRLGATDQGLLVAELKAKRSVGGRDDALAPLAARVRGWLEDGLRVVFTARTETQASRLASLLSNYELRASGPPSPLSAEDLARTPDGTVAIRLGELSAGFVLATEALALVTEEEVFGTRAHRTRARAKQRRGRSAGRAALEDLRELAVGDYVVHATHGVGRYLGLEKKTIGVSQEEKYRGVEASTVEVLVVEYAGGDKLFLPVTRLHQLQKYSGGESRAAKIDRLGGTTFAKTKAKAQKQVRQMAEELLRLYAERLAHERPELPPADRAYAEFEATFPFEETTDQANAIEDVLADLGAPRPMDRIVCGDVGFGKTEVAVRAAFRVAMAGRQVAVLCPTTVLAQQHFNTFSDRLRDYPVRVEVLSRFVDKAEQGEVLGRVKDGKVEILVGTHRLLSKDVHFRNLGLLVVDEEQRFGVTHKERIKKLRSQVDVLTLTATPIPRTLQLAVGGLRDLSLITTAPADRRAVRTVVTRWDDHVVKEAIARELSRGGQTFFVYNRIEGLYERAARLAELVPEARIAVAHGQLAEATLERTMTDFVDGHYDVLCSTAIIESGLDIPRANTILLDRADTFGLAQLYQLRGRVGRSKERAYCYLITPPPNQMTEEARARIEALERFTHLGAGFQVASLDMELRGAGDVLGAEQSGTVAAIGFDLFLHMLHEAVAELRGEPVVHDVDPELTLDLEHYIPDDYIEDVGLRLSFYKRFGAAADEQEVSDLAAEMEDRFGALPTAAQQLVRAMRLRPALRELRVLGAEASKRRVALHLREDTPLDPAKVMRLVSQRGSPYKLTPQMQLVWRCDEEEAGDALDRLEELIDEARGLLKDDA
ncbi:MAG: transcription-repair coupling factor [Sandaracinaceae bacterium]